MTATATATFDIKDLVRTIPDYPKPGIMFRDITTLIGHARGLQMCIEQLVQPFRNRRVQAVAGIEARGFILGGAVADRLRCGFVPIRKKGKLPAKAIGQEYELEYGIDIIEIHEDAISPGDPVLLIDDLIATGGTAEAAVKLLRRLDADVVGASFVIDLPDLGGSARVAKLGVECHSLSAEEAKAHFPYITTGGIAVYVDAKPISCLSRDVIGTPWKLELAIISAAPR